MLSFPHLVIIFIVALLVFGPEKLPEIARQIGKVMGDFRKASTDFQRVIQQEFAEIERQTREKEEAARRKALEAASPAIVLPPSGGAPAEGAATVPTSGSSSSAPRGDGSLSTAPVNTVANTAAKDSGYSSQGAATDLGEEGAVPKPRDSAPTSSENPATPSDVHPA